MPMMMMLMKFSSQDIDSCNVRVLVVIGCCLMLLLLMMLLLLLLLLVLLTVAEDGSLLHVNNLDDYGPLKNCGRDDT